MIEPPKWLTPKQALALFLLMFGLLMLSRLFADALMGALDYLLGR